MSIPCVLSVASLTLTHSFLAEEFSKPEYVKNRTILALREMTRLSRRGSNTWYGTNRSKSLVWGKSGERLFGHLSLCGEVHGAGTVLAGGGGTCFVLVCGKRGGRGCVLCTCCLRMAVSRASL